MAQNKKKTTTDIFCQAVKNMHPFYASYLIQRIEADMNELRKQIPAIYEKNAQDEANGKFSIFHPNFYVTYANEVITMLNDIEINRTKGTNDSPNIQTLIEYSEK
jgi:hypothetical protein